MVTNNLSMTKAELLDQYFRVKNSIRSYEENIEKKCVKGSLIKKRINNKEYTYLQWRDGEKVRSRYVKKSELNNIEKGIRMRKKYKESIKQLKLSLHDMEKFLGKELIEEYSRQQYGANKR